ncbi:CAP domain-containing protein [Haloferula sp.]|uniref:CAP domain-containing protein n=1 Tax=Haloferula sp. TaxID=2497595 RepID=UPI0032A0351B
MKTLVLISLLATACHAVAGQAADELLAAFQGHLENGSPVDSLCESLDDVEGAVLKDLNQQLNKTWPVISERYYSALESATEQGSGSERNNTRNDIRKLREDFLAVYAMGEAKMKPLLKTVSMPAIQELRKLLAPTADELVAAGPPELAKLRDATLKLAAFRDASLNAEISTTPSDSVESMRAREGELAEAAGGLSRDGLQILAKNRKIVEKEEVPADEALGIEECNLWRLYLGLNALVLDPKLCDASRDHSKDMAEQKFFAHESPVKGKTTPWDRAANFDTKASGENIYMGSTKPQGANKGWFFSPGHHKNMFNPRQVRIGLGRFGKHWTQMFGR